MFPKGGAASGGAIGGSDRVGGGAAGGADGAMGPPGVLGKGGIGGGVGVYVEGERGGTRTVAPSGNCGGRSDPIINVVVAEVIGMRSLEDEARVTVTSVWPACGSFGSGHPDAIVEASSEAEGTPGAAGMAPAPGGNAGDPARMGVGPPLGGPEPAGASGAVAAIGAVFGALGSCGGPGRGGFWDSAFRWL